MSEIPICRLGLSRVLFQISSPLTIERISASTLRCCSPEWPQLGA